MGQINHKLKKIIFNKLYKDLSHAKIILDNYESIWFIDIENKYWYLEFKKGGVLLWRYNFFTIFFELFSMESSEFQWIISEWVEEVLNRKVDSTHFVDGQVYRLMEEVLNRKVDSTIPLNNKPTLSVEEVLNRKVSSNSRWYSYSPSEVEEVLNRKVILTTVEKPISNVSRDDEVLKLK